MERNGEIDYVLDEPDVKNEYIEDGIGDISGNIQPTNPILLEGPVDKKDTGTFALREWKPRYLVLYRFGFLHSYHTKAEADADESGTSGKIHKIASIVDDSERFIFKIEYCKDKLCTFKTTREADKKKWIVAM